MKLILIASLLSTLVGCGGGGGGATEAASTSPVGVTLSGVAATGAAIPSGTVAVKCKTGEGSATTNNSGSFTVTIVGGTLPCLVKVTAQNGATLYSVAEGTGSTAVVNVSPLTDLIVAVAAGVSSENAYSNFDASAQTKLTGLSLITARNTVAIALRSVTNLSNVDPIKDNLIAGSGTGLDGQLDQLSAAMKKASLSAAQLGSTISSKGGPVSNSILASAFGLPQNPMPLNTLVDGLGQAFPLRGAIALTAAGAFNGAQYDFHKLDGTMTPCTYSSANAATCHGTNGVITAATQSGMFTQAGAVTITALTAGPDLWGYTFTGWVIGNTWSGTFIKVPTKDEPRTDWGTFSVDAVFQFGSITISS